MIASLVGLLCLPALVMGQAPPSGQEYNLHEYRNMNSQVQFSFGSLGTLKAKGRIVSEGGESAFGSLKASGDIAAKGASISGGVEAGSVEVAGDVSAKDLKVAGSWFIPFL